MRHESWEPIPCRVSRSLASFVYNNPLPMKKSILLISLLSLMVSCMSQNPQSHNPMNTERLTYFSFGQHNTMRNLNGEGYKVSTEKDGRICVVIDERLPEEKEFYLDDASIFDSLKAIVDEFKMDKYKSDYQPSMRVFDGDSWSLYYKYDSGRSVSSGGYMAWPKNFSEAHQALANYFQQWRDWQVGIKAIDYFQFTAKNNDGRDIEYTLERGDEQATLTLRNAEKNVNETLSVSNDVIAELQQVTNIIRLKEDMYDYYTDDEAYTQCHFLVRYNTGDTLKAVNCYSTYTGHREGAILNFFSRWLPE